jgi:FkbM family methyltransferase
MVSKKVFTVPVRLSAMSRALNSIRFISSHPLGRRDKAKTLLRIASWQLRSRLQHEIVVPWIADQKLAVKRGMTGATGNIYVGLHEFTDMMFLLQFLRRGDVFLDIGANVGAYTVLASGVCKASTQAFEPDPSALAALKRNVEINNLQDLVTVHEVALGASNREVAFTLDLDTANRVATAEDQHYQLIQQKQLDSVIGNGEPTLAKLDVEGHEEEVLLGGQSLLAEDSFRAIELETVTSVAQDILAKNGFRRAFYDPFRRLLSMDPVGPPSSNALFIKDFDFVNSRVKLSPKIKVLEYYI